MQITVSFTAQEQCIVVMSFKVAMYKKNGGLNATQQYSTKQQIQVVEYININFQRFFFLYGWTPSSSWFYYHLYAEIIVSQTQW